MIFLFKRNSGNKIKFWLKALIIIPITSVVILGNILALYANSSGPLLENKIIVIPRNSSMKQVANLLHQENIINNPKLFWLVAKITSQFKTLKAGEYPFVSRITPKQILQIMIDGNVVIHCVTIAEGLTVKQIIEKLNDIRFLQGMIDPNIKEGMLYPDTYHFMYGDLRQSILNRMQNRMQQTLDELWEKRADNLPFKTKEEALILASIVEKETSRDSERARVAAVFINRLRKGMKLQADPTTIYAVSNGYGTIDRPLSKKDLQSQSKYNTYYVKGLPPTAIANPGRASIAATLTPRQTNELYFVVDGTGGHHFSTNLTDHNHHVRNYLNAQKLANQSK